jgi:hypothetical protein
MKNLNHLLSGRFHTSSQRGILVQTVVREVRWQRRRKTLSGPEALEVVHGQQEHDLTVIQ